MIDKYKWFVFTLILVSITSKLNAQRLTSSVKGCIGLDTWSSRTAPIKITLSSFYYSDSVTLHKGVDSFVFNKVPYGMYELKIDANRGQTGLNNFVVEDLVVNNASERLDTIFLLLTTSSPSPYILSSSNPNLQSYELNEKHSTGELYGEGGFLVEKSHSYKRRNKLYNYLKDGVWKYYYESGKLFRYVLFERGLVKRITSFYENGQIKYTAVINPYKSHEKEAIYFETSGEILFGIKYTYSESNVPTMIIKHSELSNFSKNYTLIR